MNFLSLFAGIGGFDLGLERAGMTCIGQVEYNPWCQKVLKKHWPDVKLISDIHDVKGGEFGTVDLICGGFPCQPFSVAGKQRGKKDDRYLWPEMLRIIQKAGPSWVIGENVAGIIPMELDKVLSDLEGISYEVQTFIIPAVAADARHRRDRVWILAYSGLSELPGREQTTKLQVGPGPKIQKRKKSTSCRFPVSYIKQQHDDRPGHGASKDGRKQQEQTQILGDGCVWLPEPPVGRVANGISRRVDRLKGLGNAVVPQIPEIIGRAIMEIEAL